jgi:hypothetical protein
MEEMGGLKEKLHAQRVLPFGQHYFTMNREIQRRSGMLRGDRS